jgi:hypothetical protein
VTADSALEWSIDGGFNQGFSSRYRLIVPSGQPPGTHIPVSIRARDAAGFEAQRDTYVVAIP